MWRNLCTAGTQHSPPLSSPMSLHSGRHASVGQLHSWLPIPAMYGARLDSGSMRSIHVSQTAAYPRAYDRSPTCTM